jgi:hypothetical protein
MAYTVHQAKPVAKIVPIEPAVEEKLPFRLIGAYRGKIHFDDSVFDPLTDDQLAEYGFGALLDGELVPPPENK